MFSYIVEQCSSSFFFFDSYRKLNIHMFGEWRGETSREVKWIKARRENSIYASIGLPSMLQNFLSKNAFKQLTSLSIMIYYVMDNLYFSLPPFPMNITIHSFNRLHFSLFFPSIIFPIFIFYHLKMFFHWNLFCDNVFISSVHSL